MMQRIRSVEPVRHGVVSIIFMDGFSGEYDLTSLIGTGPAFDPLNDEAFFRTVSVGEHGHAFGWRLDDIGREIDFDADATRIHIETAAIERLAAVYRARRTAAE